MSLVLVPLAQGTEELEAVTIIDLLRRADIEVITAGLEAGPVTASRDTVLIPDTTLDQVLDQDFDMIVLPGGLPGATNLQQDSRVLKLVKNMAARGKYIAAICAAPKVLSTAGLLQGKRATCFPGSLNQQEATGIEFRDEAVIVDGAIITSRGPGTAMDFSLQLIQLLQGEETRNKVEQSLQRPKGHTTKPIKASA
ncbi:MAG TPA: DJ-1/PfpI family protein [Acidiferrobacteraceae bacterium]|nr:DJ-1/PfpI family protein [Acidiferrobacteraceae bacterium]HEX19280.1 DJ-1/PfpI family protein [Acidiferrobacteraceae bacterium]